MLQAGDRSPAVGGTTYDGLKVDLGRPGKHAVLWFFPQRAASSTSSVISSSRRGVPERPLPLSSTACLMSPRHWTSWSSGHLRQAGDAPEMDGPARPEDIDDQ